MGRVLCEGLNEIPHPQILNSKNEIPHPNPQFQEGILPDTIIMREGIATKSYIAIDLL